ncbi:MAG: VanZ family protein [Nitrosopumilus sp.]|nr:VanZ family protein [Nitrosopumilus sp.]MBA3551156.1 VanZ family protein [Patescibacteria group bacterium]
MKNVIKHMYYWIPPLALMALIFFLSSQQSIQVSQQDTVDFLAHKLVHVVMYAVLYFLVFRAFYSLQKTGKPTTQTYVLAVVISILYGASDELHQTFVPTRTGTVRDVFIDTLGIVLMFQYTKYNLQRLKLFL